MTQITKRHLDFVQEAKEAFEARPLLETYHGHDLIALRMGVDRDCINVYELGDEIANFVQQMEPNPKPRKVVSEFAHDMDKQLKVNDHKGGWNDEEHHFLSAQLAKNMFALNHELKKLNKDKHEITIRCANIANFAMMIADNEGEHL
ncbi:hypothetical protein NST02_18425 [Robertmurraya sp. FSL W8-0741]|uniref:hypothetical protein n=1 Tax=Robertmurraya sp. FSL W8-0741 TaxID=2954629 RepID=UPI0030F74774